MKKTNFKIPAYNTDWKIEGYVHPFVNTRYEINIAEPELDYSYHFESGSGTIWFNRNGKKTKKVIFDISYSDFDEIVYREKSKLVHFTFGIDIEKDLPKVIKILQNAVDNHKRINSKK